MVSLTLIKQGGILLINQGLIDKYKVALELCSSQERLHQHKQMIRRTLYKLLQSGYVATIDEIVWVECFINREKFSESTEEYRMTLRNFTEADWDNFRTAKNFDDGSPPMIAIKSLPECIVTVIVDEEQVYIRLNSCERVIHSTVKEISHLNKRYRIAIGNEVCKVIDTCLSKSGIITQLKNQLDIHISEGGEEYEEKT